MKRITTCINPECRSKSAARKVVSRGLCSACQRAMSRLIASGKFTDEDFVASGRALPRYKVDSRFGGLAKQSAMSKRLRQMAHK